MRYYLCPNAVSSPFHTPYRLNRSRQAASTGRFRLRRSSSRRWGLRVLGEHVHSEPVVVVVEVDQDAHRAIISEEMLPSTAWKEPSSRPGEEPTAYRSDLCDLFGGCETCPGISTAERCDFEDLDPLTPIFCTQ
jgi:hypothetical protein